MGVLAGSSRWSCPKLGESRRTGCVDKAVGDPVMAVLLPSSCPHDGFSRKGLGGCISCVPMEHLSHLRVLSDARVDTRVVVGLGWIRRVVGDVGVALPLCAIQYAWKSLHSWSSCDDDCKQSERIQ